MRTPKFLLPIREKVVEGRMRVNTILDSPLPP